MSETDTPGPYVVQSFGQDRWLDYQTFDNLSVATEAMRQNDRIRGRDTPWRVVDTHGVVRAQNAAAKRLPLG